jgi:hypothetical protein
MTAIDGIAQQKPPGVILKTTKRGDTSLEVRPAPGCERFKMRCEVTKDSSDFVLYLREYVDGEMKEEPPWREKVEYGNYLKGRTVFWEVVPDISVTDTLKVFVYFPGTTIIRWKFAEKGKCFKYILYRSQEKTGSTDEIPLMLFYEDDVATNQTEQLVKQHAKEGKLNPDVAKNKLLLSKIKRYAILTHVLK